MELHKISDIYSCSTILFYIPRRILIYLYKSNEIFNDS